MSHPVSLTAPQFANRPDSILELARPIGSLGFTGMFVFDHLVPLGDPRRPVLEGAATLGAIGAVSAARVGSLVTRATLRDPSITARRSVPPWPPSPRAAVSSGSGPATACPTMKPFGSG